MNNMSLQEKKVYYLLSMTLIIDAINGFLMSMINVQFSAIGIIYRMFLVIYFLYKYFKCSLENTVKVLSIILCFTISICGAYYIYNKSINGFLFDAMESIRIFLSIIITISLIEMIKIKVIRKDILIQVIFKSVKIMFWIYLISFIAGIGKSTYGNAGYKAIFNANNGITITLIVLFIFQIEKTLDTGKISDMIYTVFLLVALILLGTKSAIVFIVFYFIVKLLLENKITILIKYIIFALLFGGIIYYIVLTFFKSQFTDIINRQLYFLEAESDSLITYFLSGRDKLLNASILNFKSNLSIYSLIFGIGSYYHQLGTAAFLGFYDFKNIEMDLFDIMFSNGIFGILITYGIFIYIFIKNYKISIKKKKYSEIISFICIVIFSVTGGHIFTDAMASTYLAIVTALVFEVKNNKGEKI